MTPPGEDGSRNSTGGPGRTASDFEHFLGWQAPFSAALASIFRGKFCDALLPNRKPTTFKKHQMIYDVGDTDRTFAFLQNGFVKVGAISPAGHEVIYDVRKAGDVIGECSISQRQRSDRAVALEQTDVILIPTEEVLELLQARPEFVPLILEAFCQALEDAYAQISTLLVDDMIHRVAKVLTNLGTKIGSRAGTRLELPVYLTQEEIAKMVGARRERISTTLNSLRRQGMVEYSGRGHLVLHMDALRNLSR